MSHTSAFPSLRSRPESADIPGSPESPPPAAHHDWYIWPEVPASPPPAASPELDVISRVPPTTGLAYRFTSAEARRSFVGAHAELIVEMMKSENMGQFDFKDTVVQMASAYIYGIQDDNVHHYLPFPDLQDPTTLSDAYFTLWAHTARGADEVMPWEAFRQRVYGAFEAPRFLRELYTGGTPLNTEWTTGQGLRLTPDQRIAAALLQSDSLVSAKTAKWEVYDMSLYLHNHRLSHDILQSVVTFLDWQGNNFDQDFPTTKVHGSQAWFSLPRGQENKIFKPWYVLGQIGYHDISDWPASSNTPSPLVTERMPAELMLMILERVFKIDGEIHIIFDVNENENVAVVKREQHLQTHPLECHRGELNKGNFAKLPTMSNFFAFGTTGRDNWITMKKVFYDNNTFIIHDD